MKKITIIISVLILTGSYHQVSGQEMQYLFKGKDGKMKVSGFGAPIVEFSSVMDEFAVSVGGGGAVILNQTLYIGGYGEGLSTDHRMTLERYSPGQNKNEIYYNQRINFGHGGFWLGYIHKSFNVVHFGGSAKIGWGEVSLYSNDTYEYDYNETFAGDNCFVFIPQLEAEINITKWFKINMGVGYRLVSGLTRTYLYLPEGASKPVEKQYYDSKDFNSFQGSVSLLFGWFAQ
jgi:hypothetical protein